MHNKLATINYEKTGFFSDLVLDYLKQDEQLGTFYQHCPNEEGIRSAIAQRNTFETDRKLLSDQLQLQYRRTICSSQVRNNLSLLALGNTYTICTAHQPNIFTGPLYFIYKIIHAIRLADNLRSSMPEFNFVPVYYMGSEDADIEELGHIFLGNEKLVWKTRQTGAVGRMLVDQEVLALIDQMEGQLGVHEFGKEWIKLLRFAYTIGSTMQEATFKLINSLFGEYGLIVLIPDNVAFKRAFANVVRKELETGFSAPLIRATGDLLAKHYKVQAAGRDLNLFYLINDRRERIELSNNGFEVTALGIRWSKDEVLIELEKHPERFSSNVILRPLYQEAILPNVAFIGGGGEVAYWLELKKVFEAAGIPYPVLVLRNSFLLVTQKQLNIIKKMGFDAHDFFKPEHELINEFTIKNSKQKLDLSKEAEAFRELYSQLYQIATAIDITLQKHVKAIEVKALKKIEALEKKLIKKERLKIDSELRKIRKLKATLFPSGALQERRENVGNFYASFGPQMIKTIYDCSPSFEQVFTVISLP